MQKISNSKQVAVIELLIVFIPGFSVMLFISPLAKDDVVYRQVVIWFAYLCMLSLIGLIVFRKNKKLSSLGLAKRPGDKRTILRTFFQSILVFIFAIGSYVIGGLLYSELFAVKQSIDASNYQFLEGRLFVLIPILLAVYVASSFGEEVIYRSFLIERLGILFGRKRRSIWITILVSAVIFGLIHFEWGLVGIIQTGFMGLALGLCYQWLGRWLWPNILAHVYMDTLLLVQMYLG